MNIIKNFISILREIKPANVNMKQLIIVPKEKAKAIIPKIADADSIGPVVRYIFVNAGNNIDDVYIRLAHHEARRAGRPQHAPGWLKCWGCAGTPAARRETADHCWPRRSSGLPLNSPPAACPCV